MQKIKITKLTIKDWCCFESLEVEPNNILLVQGDNETGKSRLGSAITWVLNGTDIDGNNLTDVVPIQNTHQNALTPTVQLELELVDDRGIQRPCSIEKFYKPLLNRDKEHTGEYDTVIMLNGVKTTKKKFEAFIEENICEPEIFNMLSNVKTFTESLKVKGGELIWQKQRRIVGSLIDIPDEYEFVQLNEKYQPIQSGLLRHKQMELYQKEVKTQLNEVQREIDDYPVKLEAVQEHLTVFEIPITAEDLSNQEEELQKQRKELESENSEYMKAQNNTDYAEFASKISELVTEKDKMTTRYNNELQEKTLDLQDASHKIRDLEYKIQAAEKESERNAQNKPQSTCKACGAKFTKQRIQTALDKVIALQVELDGNVESLKKQLKEAKAKEVEINKGISELQNNSDIMFRIKDIKIKINDLSREQDNHRVELKNLPDYEERLSAINASFAELQTIKSQFIHNEKTESIARSLKSQHKENIRRKSELQMISDLCKDFIAERRELTETRVNELFSGTGISFKMFKENKTNGEIRETFEIYYNGKEYKEQLSLSTKFYISLNIALALQKAYNVSVPIVCDNMESVNFNYSKYPHCQMFVLERTQEDCPTCKAKVSSRRMATGEWKCGSCGHKWVKKLSVENVLF